MILHVDMDAFFASVEQLDNPALRGECVLVGGESDRGVVAACSYEARQYGVHSAMPMFQARRKCPDAVIVRPRRHRYKAVSKKLMHILRAFSPLVEPVSIDEAFVDITGCERLKGEPEKIAQDVKTNIFSQLKLTCSIGVAPLKFLAKIASDMDKPDGLTVIRPEGVATFIRSLPLEKVPGVGPRMQVQLSELGVRTLGDLRDYPETTLIRRLGKFGHRLRELANGVDTAAVAPDSITKSISSEETFRANTRDPKVLNRYLLRQAEEVARQLRRKNFRTKTVTLKIKFADFTLVTRQMPLNRPSQSALSLYQAAVKLLSACPLNRDVRLIGVGASGLLPVTAPVQMDLFSNPAQVDGDWEKVERTLDKISQRFGKGVIGRADSGRE